MKTFKKSGKAFLLLSVIVIVFSHLSFAQDQFRLSDYKNPDYRWQKIDLGFALGGNNNYYKQEIERGITEKKNSNRINGGLDIDYYATKNSEFYQGYQDFFLNGDVLSSHNNNMDVTNDLEDDQKSNQQNIILLARTVNRFYDKRKRFAEIDLNFDGRLNHSLHKYSADQEYLPYVDKRTDFEYTLTASLPLLIGKGRIEEVQDARLAVYILDDLRKSGDLKRAPTSEETLVLARFITQTKNQRFFDSRIRKIAEITAIDSFLTVLDLKAQSDASYYTLLNDNWDYADGPVRRTGSRFSIGLVPDIDMFFIGSEVFYRDTINNPNVIESYTHKSAERTDSWGVDFVTGYVWEKPASLYWQHIVNADLSYSLFYQQMNSKIYDMDTLGYEQKSRLNSPNLKLELGYAIGYYPNTRTHFNLGVNTSLNQYWGNEKIDDNPEKDAGKTLVNSDLYLSCYYYISPQLRFSLNVISSYLFTKRNQELPNDIYGDEITHYMNNNIGASLTYSIF